MENNLFVLVEWTEGKQLSIVRGQHLKNAKMLFSKEEGDIEWANLDTCPPPDGWEVHRGQVLNFSSKYYACLGCVSIRTS